MIGRTGHAAVQLGDLLPSMGRDLKLDATAFSSVSCMTRYLEIVAISLLICNRPLLTVQKQ